MSNCLKIKYGFRWEKELNLFDIFVFNILNIIFVLKSYGIVIL